MDENRRKRPVPALTSRQSTAERILALVWLPIHLFLLPLLAIRLFPTMEESWLNVVIYGTGAVYMVATQFRFLRRDFDPLCDHPFRMLLEVLVSYGAMLLLNMGVNGILLALMGGLEENPNNAAVVDMALVSSGPVAALAVFLAPLVEEPLFRAGIFGTLRRKSRPAAYLVSMLLFAAYHVWSYAQIDPMAWVYLVQYLPISFRLCRVYERTDSIWGSILLHMLVNYIALNALTMLEKIL